jgi:hypothetical protein
MVSRKSRPGSLTPVRSATGSPRAYIHEESRKRSLPLKLRSDAGTGRMSLPGAPKKIVSRGKRLPHRPWPHAITFPYAGIIQIRFNGYDLRLRTKPPRVRANCMQDYLGEQVGAVKG